MGASYFKNTTRRMLLDIQVPDWDEAFLAKLDPEKLVVLYRKTGADAVMFYCQSHVGLCNWPTKSGQTHRAFTKRDFVADMLHLLHQHKMKACGYYSVIYNNWAFLKHQEWRIVPAAEIKLNKLPAARYGHCCPNNPDYRNFVLTQTDELISTYAFDAFFFDMVWWPTICVCKHCHRRYRKETGYDIPKTVDWWSEGWCRFQSHREQWMLDFTRDLREQVKKNAPTLPVYHNFAVSMFNWTRGLNLKAAQHHDFLGGDFYGDPLEQLLVSKLMINLTENRPAEFMTTKCSDLTECVRLKSETQLRLQAVVATAFSAAFFIIDTIQPDGTVDASSYDAIKHVFERSGLYADYLGGNPVEDIAIYFSSDSKMTFTENGTLLSQAAIGNHNYPHLQAVSGAVQKLQEAHLPFGVITRKQLPNLQHYKAVVLPNILRMDQQEADAFRNFVAQGGCLYASRYTSLTESNGTRHRDFMLNDVLGCHFNVRENGNLCYLKPSKNDLAKAISPQTYISHWNQSDLSTGSIILQRKTEGARLATLTLPYGHPHTGSVFDENWVSIHTYPPWQDTDIPTIVKNRFGTGEVIYSAADIEAADSDAHAKLFIALIEHLVKAPWSYSADTHPAVWVTAFHQPERKRFILSLLNYQKQLPCLPIHNIPIKIEPVGSHLFNSLLRLPEETQLPFTLQRNGALTSVIKELTEFTMVAALYK